MGEHTTQMAVDSHRTRRKLPRQQTAKELGRRLLDVIVYEKGYRIGGTLCPDDLDETDIGDWKMPDYKAACAYAVSQGWLIIENDTLMLTTAGLAAA
jgi:hypothetical protein